MHAVIPNHDHLRAGSLSLSYSERNPFPAFDSYCHSTSNHLVLPSGVFYVDFLEVLTHRVWAALWDIPSLLCSKPDLEE